MRGAIKWFNPDKGYGFIDPGPEEDDLFFHVRDVERGTDEAALVDRAPVEFEPSSNAKGPTARNVRVVMAQPQPEAGEAQPPDISWDEAVQGLKQALLAAVEWAEVLERIAKDEA